MALTGNAPSVRTEGAEVPVVPRDGDEPSVREAKLPAVPARQVTRKNFRYKSYPYKVLHPDSKLCSTDVPVLPRDGEEPSVREAKLPAVPES